ncbi:MAG: GNAT family N-acetyltransferase [Gammaproteobacteria bacterium]|nr:GNAT family N-acetyltransferase [Gammaproteobacteria bacterium]MBU1443191.1 GNAT family N-acetyltransferase [Gammaproteobacteria bacterium]MBU2289423.1 GNAT family N-acetyltransferase [Gammaproteobacteria bacterium]MBU2410246.1 GNAT family N-acetyltransferase [Gammaproteobacteria bacterium]
MPPALRIRLDPLHDPRITAFLEEHLVDMRRVSPPESVYALGLEALRHPDIRFWSAWLELPSGAVLSATAALKRLDGGHAELKSMRTAAALRGQGIGGRMLKHMIAEAQASGFVRLSLETGSQPFFAPARALYERHGFRGCAPFGGYNDDPTSHFMTLAL